MTDPRSVRRAEVSGLAVDAAVAVAREHGLRVDDPVVLADQFSVQVHLRPAPVVAGVLTWTAAIRPDVTPTLERKVAVHDHLEAAGLPVVANSRELPPGPHHRDGFVVTFTEHAEPDPDRVVTVADCAALLPDLHAALAGLPVEVPLLGPAAVDVPAGLAALEQHPDLFTAAERTRLLDAHERLAPFAADPADTTTVLHGDLHPGNLLATTTGLRWNDFEDVSRGPVGWDLAMPRWIDDAAVRASGRLAGLDPEQLSLASDLRALHLTLCLVSFRSAFGDEPGWDGHVRWFLDQIGRW